MGRSCRATFAITAVVAVVYGLLPAAGATGAATRPEAPRALRVDGMDDAVGTDPDAISFAWHVADPRPGARQTAYRILVARGATTDPASPQLVWDSGTVSSAQQAFVPYTGPALTGDTRYWWTVATSDGRGNAGPFARPVQFVTGLRDGEWQAQWVRPGVAAPPDEQYRYVRTTTAFGPSPVVRATAYVAAEHKYQLWINGHRVDSGPAFAYPDEQYYQATDVTRFVHAGTRNAVGVLHHWYGPGQGRPAAQPALLVELSVEHEDGSRDVVGSDGSWREHDTEWQPAPARNDEGDFVERIDGRRAPAGWARAAYDDSSWPSVAVIGPVGAPPFGPLTAQRTRIVEHSVHPHEVRRLGDGSVVADFGVIVPALPTVRFRRGAAGRAVRMHVGDLLDADGHVSTSRGVQGTDLRFAYIERRGAQAFRPFTYLGFRYLEIDGAAERVSRKQIAADVRHTSMPAGSSASFTSSDPTLDAVWDLTARSALFSAQEQFVDTPTREKGQFLADAFNESQAVMSAFGDQNLTWQALRDFARSQARYWPDGRLNAVYPNGDGARDIPDFTELYPEWAWRYFQSTGDHAALADLFPVVARVADYVAAAIDPATGLVTELPGGEGDYLHGIVDWPPAMRFHYDMRTVARTTENALAVDVMARTAQLADIVGQADVARTNDARAKALRSAINARLRRDDGIYVDGLEGDGTPSSHASQQASAFALAFGVVPSADVERVADHVARLGIASGVMNGLWLLRALHAAGRDDHVVRLLTDRRDPGWAHIVTVGGTFTWESWTPDESEGDSLSHGWGSSALVAYPEMLLGVTTGAAPDSDAGLRLVIAAPTHRLTQLAGRVPTEAGPARIEWRRSPRLRTLRVALPPNTTAEIFLPARSAASVTEHDVPVTRVGTIRVLRARPGAVHLEVAAGTHALRFPTR